MSALIDRRDMTAQRNAQAMGAQAGGEPPRDLMTLASELALTNELLHKFIREFNGSTMEVCVTDREPPENFMRNWPLPGMSRYIAHRSGEGGTFTLAANTPLLILDAFETRFGGSVVNSGANAVTLYLTDDLVSPGGLPFTQGTAQIWLAGNGGAWDLRLGNALWCGRVTALCTVAGGSTIVAASI